VLGTHGPRNVEHRSLGVTRLSGFLLEVEVQMIVLTKRQRRAETITGKTTDPTARVDGRRPGNLTDLAAEPHVLLRKNG